MTASLFGISRLYDIFLNDMYKYHAWNVYLMTLEMLEYPFRAFHFSAAISFFNFFYLLFWLFYVLDLLSFTGLDSQMSLRARDTGSTERNKNGAGADLLGLSGSPGWRVYRFLGGNSTAE